MFRLATVLAALAIIACGQEQGRAAQPTATATATATPTPTPTATPNPSAVQPVTISGTGSKVTDPIKLPLGFYRLTWKAQGTSNFIVSGHGQVDATLVNVILPEPSSGEAAFRIVTGQVVLVVEADQATWTITLTRVSD